MDRDCTGRRRGPDQERGLRPLHPPLPEEWVSRPLRVAMSQDDWSRFEALVRTLAPQASTQARAYGQAVSALVRSVEAGPGPLALSMDETSPDARSSTSSDRDDGAMSSGPASESCGGAGA